MPRQLPRKTAFLAVVGSFSPACRLKPRIDLRIWGAGHYLPDRHVLERTFPCLRE